VKKREAALTELVCSYCMLHALPQNRCAAAACGMLYRRAGVQLQHAVCFTAYALVQFGGIRKIFNSIIKRPLYPSSHI